MLKSTYDPDTNGVIATAQLDMAAIYLLVYPVGCIYESVVSTSPATLFGGTWAALGAGRVLVGLDAADPDFDTVEETGGAKTVQASAPPFAGTPSTVIVNHTHPLTNLRGATTGGATTAYGGIAAGSDTTSTVTPYVIPNPTGGAADYTPAGANTPGAATSVVQPSLVAYRWKRTA